ncbi:MAG: hypothetical protein Q8M07_19425 [Prosthecobacter sp.]|nr:hypothetical protein [Prosthecobacter sp.]
MFKILKSLSKSLGGGKSAAPKPQAAPKAGGTLLDKINKGAPAATKSEPPKTPEELCGISSKMPKDEVRAQLKILFRRYNRSASSLDNKTRSEADKMLDAIVEVREKHFGEI